MEPTEDGRLKAERTTEEIESLPKEVIPAQGWVMDDRGEVTLVAYNSGGGASARSPQPTGVCVPRR